jgi:hypothetical protein
MKCNSTITNRQLLGRDGGEGESTYGVVGLRAGKLCKKISTARFVPAEQSKQARSVNRGAALQCLYWTRLVVDVGLIANWKGTIRGQMSFENSSLLLTAGRHELSRAELGWAGLGWAGLGEGRGVSGAR